VPTSLLHLVLRLLNNCDEPVIAASDVAGYPAGQFLELAGAGILRETSRATEIARPMRYGSGESLIVRETARGLFGVACEDDYHDPLPLTEEDVKQYSISVTGLVKEIRRRNQIVGSDVRIDDGLILVGTKQVPGVARLPVYLSLPNIDQAALLERTLRARRGTAGTMAVVIVPEEASITAELQRTLDDSGVLVISLPATSALEGLAMDWSAILQSLPGSAAEKEQFVFRKKGQSWELTFEGRTTLVRESKGILYIAELMRSPGREVFVAELFAAARGVTHVPLGASGETLDDKARRDYRQRAEDLNFQLAEAEKNNDSGRCESIRLEIEELADQMLAGQGLAGRPRRSQDDRDRIRKSVSMAIDRAIGTIRKHAPALGEHLDNCIHRGYFLSYSGSIPWKF
jgi:hypothetical protein